MDRRNFLRSAASSAALAAVTVADPTPAAAETQPSVSERRPPRMKLGCQWPHFQVDPWQFRSRFGVTHLCAYPPTQPDNSWDVDALTKFREHIESYGLVLDMLPLTKVQKGRASLAHHIMRADDPQRDRDIDLICDRIRVAAKAGIPSLRYGLGVLGILHTPPTDGRGGTRYNGFQLHKVKNADELTDAGRVYADAMWERITYFLDRVVPVANENKVRIACHPNDPWVPPGFRGVDRVLGTPEGLKKFIKIQESDYHGLNFCVGTVAEMLEKPDEQIDPIIRYFGERKKLFNIHLRNIRGRRGDFFEVHHDEGDLDLARIVRLLYQLDYPYMVMPDHVPWHPEHPEWETGFAFAYGYIRGLIQSAGSFG